MVAAIITLISPQALLEILDVEETAASLGHLSLIAVVLAGMVGLAANPCAVSISMEGRHLWVLKSMPIEERTIFSGKVISQMELLVLPVMVSVIVLLIRLEQPMHIVVLGALLILFEGFGDALLGLLINLSYPKLDWDRELVVYKRSFSSLLGVVWGIVFNMVLLSVSLSIQPDPDLCIRIAVMVLGPLDLLLLWALNTKGIELFHKLS